MRTQKKTYVVLAVAALLLFLIFSGSRNISSPARTGLTDSVSPALSMPSKIARAVSYAIPFAGFREENRVMRQRLASYARSIEEARAVYAENQRLKDLLGFRKTIPFSTVPAAVIGRDPSNWSNSLIIDKGSESGVMSNKAVISPRGLVGRVVELGRRSGKVLLITDPNSKVGVVVSRNRQGGILLGKSDNTCKMIYIALDSDIAKGDKVMTAGLGSVYPKNIPVGEVISVGKEPGRLYKYAVIKPAEDLSKLEEVLCVR